MKFTVSTWAEGSKIVQETVVDSEVDGIRNTIIRRVVETEDARVREVLVGLGWTPPKEGKDESNMGGPAA